MACFIRYEHSIYAYKAHYYTVLEVTWRYIELLKELLTSSMTALPYFEELKALGEINFKFANKMAPDSLAAALAVRLNQWYTTEDVLRGPYMHSEYSPDAIKEVLNSLRPENARVFLAAKSFEDIDLQGRWLQEKWYGTDYMHGPLENTTSVCFHARTAVRSLTWSLGESISRTNCGTTFTRLQQLYPKQPTSR